MKKILLTMLVLDLVVLAYLGTGMYLKNTGDTIPETDYSEENPAVTPTEYPELSGDSVQKNIFSGMKNIDENRMLGSVFTDLQTRILIVSLVVIINVSAVVVIYKKKKDRKNKE